MWVCRAGKNGVYLDFFIRKSRIYLAWDGFNIDFMDIKHKGKYRDLVREEKNTDNPTSISNWSGQITAFVETMKKGDMVLIPSFGSHSFALVQITGDYEYNKEAEMNLYHSRRVNVILLNIPKGIFPQHIQYGLRAYRTVYKVKNEDEIMLLIGQWQQEERL